MFKFNKNGPFPLICFIIVLLFSTNIFSQTKSNLNIFYSMVDSSSSLLLSNVPNGNKKIEINMPPANTYFILNERLLNSLASKGIDIKPDSISRKLRVNYVIDNARVSYTNMSRNGVFGSYYVNRNITLSGSFIIIGSGTVSKTFDYKYSDNVKLDSVKECENRALPFTHGELPAEPFFSSLVEPAIAVASAAVTVILFFTVRSK